MKSILSVVLILVSGWTFTQTSFYKQFSNNGYDFGQGVINMPDSSYVITGASSSFTDGPSQMFLLKIDSLGNRLWAKHFGGAEIDWGRRVRYIENEGFLVGGFTNSFGNGAYDFALWKIDESGNEEWVKTYGTEYWERVHGMEVTSDKGVILVGETNNTADGLTDMYIVRTDSLGNVVWENQIENAGADNAMAIIRYDDSTFIVGGYTFNNTTDLSQSHVFRIQDNGTILWDMKYGTDVDYNVNDLDIENQSVIVAGTQRSATESFIRLFRIDGITGVVEETSYQQANPKEDGVGIASFQQAGWFSVCSSSTGIYSFGQEDLFFFALETNGYYQGTVGSVQYATSQVLGEIITTYNKGMIAVGYNEDIGPGGSTVFAIRIGTHQPSFSSNDSFTTESLVSVKDVDGKLVFALYPNPANEKLHIQSSYTLTNYKISIVDLTGKNVLYSNSSQLQNNTLDVSSINPGMYILSIITEQGEQFIQQKIEIRR